MKPVGALTQKEFEKGENRGKTYYSVYGLSHPSSGYEKGFLGKFTHHQVAAGWFTGHLGYVFDNYFHALAYSLKVKDEANRRKHHSAVTNP
jgi:hypothetical protein